MKLRYETLDEMIWNAHELQWNSWKQLKNDDDDGIQRLIGVNDVIYGCSKWPRLSILCHQTVIATKFNLFLWILRFYNARIGYLDFS